MAWRNERQYYRRTCDASGKQIISIYSPDKPFKVYDQKVRRSDQRNPLSYGRDFDFSKTFTENFRALQVEVPRCAVLNGFGENADYCNHSYYNKNSYMCSGSTGCEDCYYSNNMYGRKNKNCIDIDEGRELDNCYECFKIQNCTACFFCNNCSDCFQCSYCDNCVNCSFCFGCSGLVNKQYCINNVFVGREAFEKAEKTFASVTAKQIILPAFYGFGSEKTYGMYLNNSKNAI